MAEKFLETEEMQEILEEIEMTRLGRMLVDEGIRRGKEQGIEQTKLDVARKLLGLLDVKVISERVGLSVEKIMELQAETKTV